MLDCDQCDEFYIGECPTHNFNIIKDNGIETGKMPSAIKSLPNNLYVKPSIIPEAGMGVFTTKKIPINSRFGPYRGVKVLMKDLEEGRNTSYMWEVEKTFSECKFFSNKLILKLGHIMYHRCIC